MSDLSSFLSSIEIKIKQTEANVASALAQYHGLTGILSGLQNVLADAKAVIGIVAPTSSAEAVVNAASEVVNEVQSIAEPEQAPDVSSPPVEDVPQ
jgi:dsDNA-specific endonuclease/ATPase MutS2